MKALLLAALLATSPVPAVPEPLNDLTYELPYSENLKDDFNKAVLEMAEKFKNDDCKKVGVSAFMNTLESKLIIMMTCLER